MLRYLALLSPRHRRNLALVGLLMLVAAVLEGLGLGLLIPFLHAMLQPDPAALEGPLGRLWSLLGEPDATRFMLWMSGGLVVAFVIKTLVSLFATWARSRIVFALYREFAARILSTYLTRPYTFHLEHNSAELLRRVSEDTLRFFSAYVMAGLIFVAELLVILVVVTGLVVIEPALTLLSAAFLTFMATVVLRRLKHATTRYGHERQAELARMYQWIQQGLGGIKETQVLGAQPFFVERFDRHSRGFAEAQRKQAVLTAIPKGVFELAVVLLMCAAVILLRTRAMPIEQMLPTLVFFGAAAIRLAPSAIRAVDAINTIRNTQSSADAIEDALREIATAPQPGRVLAHGGGERIRLGQRLELRDVTYRYPNAHRPALDGVSLSIDAGSTVGFVGATGAGKTTIVDLVLGLLSPDDGALLVDGEVINDRLIQWRRGLGYVPQFIYLSDLSIRENVAFGVPEGSIDDERVWQALRSAQLAEHVAQLPDGLDTIVGERGVRLSGGQRQRIGIARALYHDPELLVLDEATSALDSDTESRVSAAIESLHGQRTILLIAHRLSTVRSCDRIHVMDNGRVVDSGTYDELLTRSPLFQRLAGEAAASDPPTANGTHP